MAQIETGSSPPRPLKVGIVGTGYAAKRRAEAFLEDSRACLVAVSGHTTEATTAFCQDYSVSALDSWQELVKAPNIDLVVICTVNYEHGKIACAALEAGKHVVVEYPLSLDLQEAEWAIALAQKTGKLLHVEHIELLGGLHGAIRQHLPEIGQVFYARYSTIVSQRPAPRRWTYDREMFGFPLMAALSRVHRLTDLFGAVASVSCQSRFWDASSGYYTACLCSARLNFASGLIAEVTYGKGEVFWQGDRTFVIHGDRGTLVFDGEEGMLVRGEENTPVEVASRRGLFVKDTQMVLNCIFEGVPLYVTPQASCYALKVADAARASAQTGTTILLNS